MSQENIEIMADCLSRLKQDEIDRLVRHVDAGTPICCGQEAPFLTDGKGAGCPAVLASEDNIPLTRLFLSDDFDWEAAQKVSKRAHRWHSVWLRLSWHNVEFGRALAYSTPDDVREAIKLGAKKAKEMPHDS